MSTIATRQKAVEQMSANSALEDLHPDATDRALQRGYVAGSVTIEDLLQHARQYAATARQSQSKIRTELLILCISQALRAIPRTVLVN